MIEHSTESVWGKFNQLMIAYISIGVIVSLLNAISTFLFQNLLDSYLYGFKISTLVFYSIIVVIIPILSYIEQEPKTKLNHGIYFFLKKKSLEKISHISYMEYIHLGSGELLQKVEAGASSGRNIHLNFYARLFRELIPEAVFNLIFIAIIDKKLIPFILIGYVIVFL